jgi:hypothetical protein
LKIGEIRKDLRRALEREFAKTDSTGRRMGK